MTQLAIFFMQRSFGGGATSFTVHLCQGFELAGIDYKIYRVGKNTEGSERKFAKYEGLWYRNVSIDDAIKIIKRTPSLMTSTCHSKHLPFAKDAIPRMLNAGLAVVTHDPNEFKHLDYLPFMTSKNKQFCIRPTMHAFYPKAILIPHPYHRYFRTTVPTTAARPWNAVSIARVSFVKRVHIILEANRFLDPKDQVVLRGAENRLYTKFAILPKYPEFKQGQSGFPLTWGASAIECSKARYAVDMTWFPDDGGGTQYSFMEAWDAGAINVLHEDWLRYKGEMVDRKNCVAVKGPLSLARVLQKPDSHEGLKIVEAGYKALRRHRAEDIAKIYAEELLK